LKPRAPSAYGCAAWLLDVVHIFPVHCIPSPAPTKRAASLLLHDFA
jgi:hypothetical protein